MLARTLPDMHLANQPPAVLTDPEFQIFQKLIHEWAGIYMAETKKALVSGRLMKRLRHYELGTYSEYIQIVKNPLNADEKQVMINLLTTNETYFFREPKHFDWLRQRLRSKSGDSFRIWSAACSSGQEVYTMAMILAEELGSDPWEIYGSDISQRILSSALAANYPIEQAAQIPEAYLKKYCLKGVKESEGKFCFNEAIRSRTHFFHINLIETLPLNFGQFDLIFLRNVMIYFDRPTRQKVAESLMQFLKPDGNLVIGHAESLHGITDKLKAIQPTIYAAKKHMA